MRIFKAARLFHGALTAALLCVAAAHAQTAAPEPAAAVPFKDWLSTFRSEATAQGIRAETVTAALPDTLAPIPRILELDRKQPEFSLTFPQYLNRIISDERVRTGRARLAENRVLLTKIGRMYGVQPRFIVALWGIETNFGQLTGGFDVIPALVTLAHDGRRSDYFRKELLNALKIVDQGHVPLSRFTGSWAGAMGQCQFMPSSFLNFAADHDGDGHKDIWQNRGDVFASIASYLKGHNWEADRTWGRKVRLPQGLDPALASLEIRKPLTEWTKLGVTAASGAALPQTAIDAALVLPAGPSGPAYLVYDNFTRIMSWNKSTFFALTVGELADRIGQ
jgi:membrane-bound lytic murein transglycosylase B